MESNWDWDWGRAVKGVLVVIDSGLIIITSKAFILFVYSALDFLISSYAFLFIYVLAWLYDAFYVCGMEGNA